MESSYQEFRPSPALMPYVECYWLHAFNGLSFEESAIQRCLPIGMLEILIHIDDNRAGILHNGQWQCLPHAFFTGIYNSPVIWKATGNVKLFGIRLKPETFSQLFNIPAASLFCNYIELETFFGKAINRLPELLYEQYDMAEAIHRCDAFLMQQLAMMCGGLNYVAEAVSLIRSRVGSISIEEVSTTLSVSMRQLQRSFKEQLGTSPKSYHRIIRFRNAFTALESSPKSNWADIAYTLGYADQAHFIREFKEFAGEAPGKVIKNNKSYTKRPFELTGDIF